MQQCTLSNHRAFYFEQGTFEKSADVCGRWLLDRKEFRPDCVPSEWYSPAGSWALAANVDDVRHDTNTDCTQTQQCTHPDSRSSSVGAPWLTKVLQSTIQLRTSHTYLATDGLDMRCRLCAFCLICFCPISFSSCTKRIWLFKWFWAVLHIVTCRAIDSQPTNVVFTTV